MVQLDELEIVVVIDNETDTLSSVDNGVPQIPEIVHLAAALSGIAGLEISGRRKGTT